jgi:hypothetical protein
LELKHSILFKYFGYTFNERATDKAHMTGSEKGKEGNGMCLRNKRERERNWGGDFRRRMTMFERWKGRVQDTEVMLERKEKEQG